MTTNAVPELIEALVASEGDEAKVTRNEDGTFTVDAEWLEALMEEASYGLDGN